MNMEMKRLKHKVIHWFIGDYIAEVSAMEMMPELKSAWREYLQILRDILSELKLLRVTGFG